MKIQGSVVLITGASQGIGAALAEVLREKGALLALAARSESRLRETAGAADLLLPGDLTREEDRARIVETATRHFGRIDALVNNAGVGLYAPAWRSPDSESRYLFELNLFAPLALTRLVVPGMRQRRSGLVVNVSSIAGQVTLPWLTLYSAAKAALDAMTAGMRMELRRDGVRFLLVSPGYVRTGFQDHVLGGRPPEALRGGRRFATTPRRCALDIARGMERGARQVVSPALGSLVTALHRAAPRFLESRLCKIYESAGAAG
jgi:short-subunit dehydrogenase